LIANLMTYGTLAVEGSLAVLVWNRRARPWVLLAGVFLHLGIELTIRVGFFSLGMITLYLVFLDPDWAAAHLLAFRKRQAPTADRARRREAEAQPRRRSGAIGVADVATSAGTSEPPPL
jgi:hypothetical protein